MSAETRHQHAQEDVVVELGRVLTVVEEKLGPSLSIESQLVQCELEVRASVGYCEGETTINNGMVDNV